MNTPSHLIITAALRKRLAGRIAIPRGAFLLGSVLPDLPLFFLVIGSQIYFRYLAGANSPHLTEQTFDYLYFNNPWWIASHNVLHSPTLLLIVLGALWGARDLVGTRRHWCFWFVLGCLLHTALDIPTHVDDGPVVFFPFDWSYRFHSPISYWDPRHYGRQFTVFEAGLDLLLLGYLWLRPLWRWAKRRRRAPVTDASS
jgi:hypothetical protein